MFIEHRHFFVDSPERVSGGAAYGFCLGRQAVDRTPRVSLSYKSFEWGMVLARNNDASQRQGKTHCNCGGHPWQ